MGSFLSKTNRSMSQCFLYQLNDSFDTFFHRITCAFDVIEDGFTKHLSANRPNNDFVDSQKREKGERRMKKILSTTVIIMIVFSTLSMLGLIFPEAALAEGPYYATKEEAVSHVPTYIVPKDCFVWKDGPAATPWRVIPGFGCAHWVAHELGLRIDSPWLAWERGEIEPPLPPEAWQVCYDGFYINVVNVIAGRTEVEISKAKVGDIWTYTDLTHTGIVRQIEDGKVLVEHCSNVEGGVVQTWFTSGKCWRAPWGKSYNVAVVDDYYGSAVGYLYPSDYPGQTFSILSASQVSAEKLTNYDTVILFMFNPSLLTAVQKAAINDWVYKGGKLIVWDSDQVPPGHPWDYTWLPYPFTTSTPGQTGARTGKLEVMEENQLSSSDSSSSYYIDTDALVHYTDAVGDATVLITYSPGWRIDMMATNVLGETGPAHVYAAYGSGLMIYSALDWDYAGSWSGWNWGNSGVWLKKLLKQELDCSCLPFVAPPVPGEVGLKVEVTSEAPEGYYTNKPINFKVTVTNPTDQTGINIIAYNVELNIIVPEEIEVGIPTATIGNIGPGESKTATSSGNMKKAGENIEVIVNARGEDHTLWETIAGSGKCTLSIREPEAPKPSWSFAIITDLHIGFNNKVADWDIDGKLETDYDGRTWDDSGLGDDYWLTENLIHALQRITDEKDNYNIRFVVVLGDISDTAEKSEFLRAKQILNRLNDPNADGNADDGIPYVPLFGNHDTWPYTQDSSDPHDRKHHDTIAPYAKGDQFFQEVFWDQNPTNNKLILQTLKEWKKQPVPVYSWTLSHDIYFQNYAFSYWESENKEDKIDFVCLDLSPRDPVRAYPGSLLGGFAVYHGQTKEFLEDYLKNHQKETVMVLSHYPLLGFGGFLNPSAIIDVISKNKCNGYDFGGHTHRNHVTILDNVPVIETESVSQIKLMFPGTDYPASTHSGQSIRIVQVTSSGIDYSTTLKPSKEIDTLWPTPFFTYTYASYPEPNEEIIFTAHFTPYHGFKTSFDWDFGDGTFGSGSSVKHSYTQEGEYIVTLTVTTRNLITGEERSQTVTGSVCVHSKHVISHLPPDLHATSLQTEEDLTQVPKNIYQPTLITKSTSEEPPIAELEVHFEEATEDIDLSTLVANVDSEKGKSVIYMPTWPVEIDQYKQLFIPSTGAGTVYICLYAISLDDVSLENADVILNVGETKDGITVTTTFYNGREYYLVYGVTGTGGGELKERRDVAITDIILSANTTYIGRTVTINVTASNLGNITETFNVTLYCDNTPINTTLIENLPPDTNKTTTFHWDTIGVKPCNNYNITAKATILPGETNTTNNILTDGKVKIKMIGDIDGDGQVDMKDISLAARGFGSFPGHPRWDPNLDINNDGKVDLKDVGLIARNFGKCI